MEEKIDARFIINELKERVENKKAHFDTHIWLDSAMKLNILLTDEYDELAELTQKVAELRLMWLEGQEKKNVSEAKLRVEASNEYKEMRKQENKCKQIEEFVRIAKKMSDRNAGV